MRLFLPTTWSTQFIPEDWLAEETYEVEQSVLSEIARCGSICMDWTAREERS